MVALKFYVREDKYAEMLADIQRRFRTYKIAADLYIVHDTLAIDHLEGDEVIAKYIIDGAAAYYSKPGLYKCGCGWHGSMLAYADDVGMRRFVKDSEHSSNRGHNAYIGINQGYCPNCGAVFSGCFEWKPEQDDK